VCNHAQVLFLFNFISLIPQLIKARKTPRPGHSASSNPHEVHTAQSQSSKQQPFFLALHNAQYFPPRTVHYIMWVLIPSPWARELCNRCLQPPFSKHCAVSTIKPQPWSLELCNYTIPWPLSVLNYALGNFRPQASILSPCTPQLCNFPSCSPIWTAHRETSSLKLDLLSPSIVQSLGLGL